MKKLAFFVLCMFAIFDANAQWDYKLSGHISGIPGYVHVENGENNTEEEEEVRLFWDGKILGDVFYVADDLTFGLHGEIERDEIKEFYAYFQMEILRVEVGREFNMAKKFHVSVPEVSGLRFNKYIDIFDLIDTGNVAYLTKTELNQDDKSQKISLISKKYGGLQFGVSYASGAMNQYDYNDEFYRDDNNNRFKDSLVLGAKFVQDWGFYKLDISAGAMTMRDANNITIDTGGIKAGFERMNAISSGINLTAGNWVFGVSGKLIDEQNPMVDSVDYSGYVVAGGVKYSFLQYSISLDAQRSNVDGDSLDTNGNDIVDFYQLSLNYNPYEDWNFWVSGGYVEMQDGGSQTSSTGVVGLLGLTYIF